MSPTRTVARCGRDTAPSRSTTAPSGNGRQDEPYVSGTVPSVSSTLGPSSITSLSKRRTTVRCAVPSGTVTRTSRRSASAASSTPSTARTRTSAAGRRRWRRAQRAGRATWRGRRARGSSKGSREGVVPMTLCHAGRPATRVCARRRASPRTRSIAPSMAPIRAHRRDSRATSCASRGAARGTPGGELLRLNQAIAWRPFARVRARVVRVRPPAARRHSAPGER